jgi:hypothetical protein
MGIVLRTVDTPIMHAAKIAGPSLLSIDSPQYTQLVNTHSFKVLRSNFHRHRRLRVASCIVVCYSKYKQKTEQSICPLPRDTKFEKK